MSNSSLVNIDLRTRNVTNCCGFMNYNEKSALFSILDREVYKVIFNTNVTSILTGITSLLMSVVMSIPEEKE